jgi:hypothetical protein
MFSSINATATFLGEEWGGGGGGQLTPWKLLCLHFDPNPHTTTSHHHTTPRHTTPHHTTPQAELCVRKAKLGRGYVTVFVAIPYLFTLARKAVHHPTSPCAVIVRGCRPGMALHSPESTCVTAPHLCAPLLWPHPSSLWPHPSSLWPHHCGDATKGLVRYMVHGRNDHLGVTGVWSVEELPCVLAHRPSAAQLNRTQAGLADACESAIECAL